MEKRIASRMGGRIKSATFTSTESTCFVSVAGGISPELADSICLAMMPREYKTDLSSISKDA